MRQELIGCQQRRLGYACEYERREVATDACEIASEASKMRETEANGKKRRTEGTYLTEFIDERSIETN